MSSWIVAAVTAPLLAYLFLRFYRSAYPTHHNPVHLQSRSDAVRAAAAAVRRLTQVDVAGWDTFAAVQSDDEVTDKLHHLRAATGQRAFCVDWGLTGSWRVRFVDGSRGSVVIGLSCRGDVILLDVVGAVRDQIIEREKHRAALPGPLVASVLSASGGRLWMTTRHTGHGCVELADGGAEHVAHLRATTDLLRVEATAHSIGSAVLRLDTVTEVVAPIEQNDHLEHEERREAIASTAGLLGSVAALVLGVVVLGLVGARADPTFTLVLTGIVLAAALSHELSNTQRGIVDGYDGSVPWATFRTINITLVVIGVAVASSVVLISGMAGSAVAGEVGLALVAEPGQQLLWGTWAGLVWLALAAVAFAGLKKAALALISETPDGRALRLGGISPRFIAAVVAQSAIAEEVVYRLLVLSVVLWASGSVPLAVGVSAALWASMHVGSAVSPRWIRMLELFIVGIGLGALTVTVGLLAAIVAHAVFNAATLVMPLLLRPVEAASTGQPPGVAAPARDLGPRPTT